MVIINNYIANYVAILNYAIKTKRSYCRIIYTKLGETISSLLFKNGYLLSYRIVYTGTSPYIYIQLKKSNMFNPLNNIKLISRPNNNIYWSVAKIINECFFAQNITCYVLTTPCGILFSNNAIERKVGGKLLFQIN